MLAHQLSYQSISVISQSTTHITSSIPSSDKECCPTDYDCDKSLKKFVLSPSLYGVKFGNDTMMSLSSLPKAIEYARKLDHSSQLSKQGATQAHKEAYHTTAENIMRKKVLGLGSKQKSKDYNH